MNLEEAIKNRFPEAKYVSNNTELLIRCPFCGDSKKDKSDAHFYISIRDDRPHFFHCFLCNIKGILNRNILRRMSIFDIDAIRDVEKKVSTAYTPLEYINIYIPEKRTIDEKIKLYYIANRLGTLAYSDYVNKFRPVTSLRNLLKYNNLSIKNERLVDYLDRFYLGFLLEDKSSVLFRKIVPWCNGNRWYRYSIFDSNCSSYTIDNKIEFPCEPNIYIAEGVLDVISMYINSEDHERRHGIYLAVGNRNYNKGIRDMIQRLPATHQHYHVFMDNDLEFKKTYNLLRQEFLSLNGFINITLHRNEFPGEKDYGVPVSRIKDVLYRVI